MLGLALLTTPLFATPPEGFPPLFNGKNFDGWWGAATANPAKYLALPANKLAEQKKKSLKDIAKHWKVNDGIIHNDGHGLFLTTEKNYSDFELRGIPQVQLWDTTEAGGSWKHGAKKGSGRLWKNPKDTAGRDPLVHADKPIGEWKKMTIKLVVDNAKFFNYFDKKGALPNAGPIQLQTHGTPVQWRNLFVKEL